MSAVLEMIREEYISQGEQQEHVVAVVHKQYCYYHEQYDIVALQSAEKRQPVIAHGRQLMSFSVSALRRLLMLTALRLLLLLRRILP